MLNLSEYNFYLPEELILFFSEDVRNLYSKEYGRSFSKSSTFRLGVIDDVPNIKYRINENSELNICIVGRLVGFKTYIKNSVDMIANTIEFNSSVTIDIYGNGPDYMQLLNYINEKKLSDRVKLKGGFLYSEFNAIVTKYDLFIGSGTSIIQAASLGVPSIVGVEHNQNDTTYGFFSDVSNREYNMLECGLEMNKTTTYIKRFMSMTLEEKKLLSDKHVQACTPFIMDKCRDEFEFLSDIAMPSRFYRFNIFAYECSKIITGMLSRLFPGNSRNFGNKKYK